MRLVKTASCVELVPGDSFSDFVPVQVERIVYLGYLLISHLIRRDNVSGRRLSHSCSAWSRNLESRPAGELRSKKRGDHEKWYEDDQPHA
jgi:hypothetical protein